MADLPAVPALLSLEGRASMIAEEISRIEHAGKPDKRREHVKAHALAHLRAALVQVKDNSDAA